MLKHELFVTQFNVALREVTAFQTSFLSSQAKIKAVTTLSRTADEKKNVVKSSLEKNLSSGRPFVHRIYPGYQRFFLLCGRMLRCQPQVYPGIQGTPNQVFLKNAFAYLSSPTGNNPARISSVGRALDGRAGGRVFNRIPGPDQYSGSWSNRPFALRDHVTLLLWKWKLYAFAFEKRLLGHILNKTIIVIWYFKPAPFS